MVAPVAHTSYKLTYSVKAVAKGEMLLEYRRDHYGKLSVGELLAECLNGLQNVLPAVGSPVTIIVSVQ
jgi:hypothetical protein